MTKDFEEQKNYHKKRCQNRNNKCFCKRDTAKKKKNKVEQQKRYAENRKNEDKISPTKKGKKYNLQHNCKSSQIEKSQDKIPNGNTEIDNNKCLQKRDIVKKKKNRKPEKVC